MLSNPADLKAIEECGIDSVWIDSTKAADLPATPEAVEKSPLTTVFLAESRVASTTFAEEISRARAICGTAKGQMQAMFQDARLGNAIDLRSTSILVDEIAASIERHPLAMVSVARLKTHDDYTYMHSVAVCALMLSLARQLKLGDKETQLAGIGGMMHDIGKSMMPLDVLNKPGKLSAAEFDIMKRHPLEGARILQAGGADPAVVDIAMHHHEKMDGRGYPGQQPGDEITLLSRMAAVCDVYDAVTSNRAYKRRWDPSDAMRQMAQWEGHFDKQIFNAFVKAVGIYPVGSLVRMESDRLAVVVETDANSLLTPKVRVFFSLLTMKSIAAQTIDLSESGCKDTIAAREDQDKWGFSDLDELWMQ